MTLAELQSELSKRNAKLSFREQQELLRSPLPASEAVERHLNPGGRELPELQTGGPIPTKADSLFLLNNNKVIKGLLDSGYKWSNNVPISEPPFKSKEDAVEKIKEIYKTDTSTGRGGKGTKDRKSPLSDYLSIKGEMVGTSDWKIGGGDDKGVPMQYVHPRIAPQFKGDLVSKDSRPTIYSYGYDDLAITPWDMLTPEQRSDRIMRHGDSGTPFAVPAKSESQAPKKHVPVPEYNRSKRVSPEELRQAIKDVDRMVNMPQSSTLQQEMDRLGDIFDRAGVRKTVTINRYGLSVPEWHFTEALEKLEKDEKHKPTSMPLKTPETPIETLNEAPLQTKPVENAHRRPIDFRIFNAALQLEKEGKPIGYQNFGDSKGRIPIYQTGGPVLPKYQTGTPASTTSVTMPPMLPLDEMVRQNELVKRRAENERLAQQLPNELKYQGPVPSQEKVDYPSTDRRSSNYVGNPNMGFMAPGRTGQMRSDMEAYHSDVINTALPIPGANAALKGVEKGAKGIRSMIASSKSAGTSNPVTKASIIPDPAALLDKVVPKPFAPGHYVGMEDSWNYYSPLNLIPGYGKRLKGDANVGFRKFGNSLEDVIESQSLRPAGSGIGSKQIKGEGNWAQPARVNEHYPGVFEATMDPKVPGSDIQLLRMRKRRGVVGTTKDNNVEIPLSDPGLSFNRRLPFSSRYVPIDKEKLARNQFQLSTFAPNTQSLVEKYGLWAAHAAGLGYLLEGEEGAKEGVRTLNRYTIDPVIEQGKKVWKEEHMKRFKEILRDRIRKEAYLPEEP